MIECTIDTHVLADIIMQYSAAKPTLLFERSEFLTDGILKKINPCIESNGFRGVIIASAFAFIEIINQFDTVSKGKFDLPKLIGILNQPPEWFIIEPYTDETVGKLVHVPKYNLDRINVGLEDAIHVATAMQRGPNTFLATHDGILSRINYRNLNLIHVI